MGMSGKVGFLSLMGITKFKQVFYKFKFFHIKFYDQTGQCILSQYNTMFELVGNLYMYAQ